jgi:outer membrane protein assembly factor BamB/cytochrome c553
MAPMPKLPIMALPRYAPAKIGLLHVALGIALGSLAPTCCSVCSEKRCARMGSKSGVRAGAGLIVPLVVVVALVVAGCGGGSKKTSTTSSTAAGTPTTPAGAATTATPAATTAAAWTLPNADLGNTRSVSSQIRSSNVSQLGVAWTVPIRGTGAFGNYATTPVVVGGVVYTQNLTSDVQAIDFRTGRVLWTRTYSSPNTGPNGVSVVDGRVFGATQTNAFALSARTGEQLWSRRLIRNANEGIDMAPGVNNGTVYVSTVPGNPRAFYAGNGQAILWAMDANTGATRWKWDEVPASLWGNPKVNSGGGQWEPPSFDAAGNVYLNVSNPAPFVGSSPSRPSASQAASFGGSRPGPNLYTDSVVKLDAASGRLMWHYQLTPHDVYDWDLNNSPILAQANGTPVTLSAGKGGIAIANDANTGRLVWRTAVGRHNGHDNDHTFALHRQYSKLPRPSATFSVFPGELGGVESPMASDGTTLYVPINNLAGTVRKQVEGLGNPATGTGEVVALDVATGRVRWDHRLPSSAYGAAAVTNDLVFTTTFDGMVYALNKQTGAVAWSRRLPAGTNAPVAIDDDTIITAGSFPSGANQRPEIVAYRLGATGAAPTPTTSTQPPKQAGGGGASAAAGRPLFRTNCATCHTLADAGATGTSGPNLDQLRPNEALVVRQVTNGGPGMPAFGGTLSRTQIDSIARYVSSVAGKGGGGGGGGGAPAP